MDIRAAIFDMDGTLTDSMFIWHTVGSRFLKARGIEPAEDFDLRFSKIGAFQGVRFFREEYGINESDDELMAGIDKIVEDFYLNRALAKDGVPEILEEFKSKGIKMCVATLTTRYQTLALLERCGILGYFEGVLTGKEIGVGKEKPDIFLRARDILGEAPEDIAVFEDSAFAALTAKRAGFHTVGLFDEYYGPEAWDELRGVCEMSAVGMRELFGKFNLKKKSGDF